MPAKRIYQVKLLTKAGGQRGYVSVYGVNVRDIYLFLVSNFKSKEPHRRLPLLPGSPPGAWLALGPSSSSHPSPLPPALSCVSLMGLQRMNLLNYRPFHVTEQFQRCHILLFGDP